MNPFTSKRNQGVTLIELLVVISVVAIILAFAAPSLENATAHSDLKEATEQVSRAFRTARTVARIHNSSVTVTLTTNSSANSISYSFPNGISTADGGLSLPAVQLPDRISVTGETAVFTYNPMGMVDSTGSLALASTTNSDFVSTVTIDTLMGHVTTYFNSMGGS